ncbi:hypothetical protein [Thiorhodovibrio frisius]|uniref:Uncharacterized protein n=1 Tax=Thiorhodovibrio frisius TaxID=631362 RepID=H8Z4V7_9GAMM|nr:hypothetical protein [Thiorhodovibrio frisius]EIC20364.1 hypothetical protein Thi970DRAFT_03993 [Thiorhodovibrio frisius]WPL21104.1 hypothetical protein Thiofri_01212 [Thiorhodovibrio frisius]
MMFLIKKLARALLMLFIWGLAGGVFGAVFVSMRYMLGDLGFESWYPLLIGACAAAMTTAALYSAMFVALVGAAAGVLASIAYLMLYLQVVDLAIITAVAASAGLIAGLFFNRGREANARAFGVTFTGLLAGAGAGLAIAIALQLYVKPIDDMVVVAGVVALVGTLFQLNHHWLLRGCSGWPWTRLGGPLVAAWIAGVVGVGVWLMVGTTSAGLELDAGSSLKHLFEQIPNGSLGGAVGGAVTGLLLELLGFGLADEKHDI